MMHKSSVVLVWADTCDAVRAASNLTQPQAFWDAAEVYFVHCHDDVVGATAGVAMGHPLAHYAAKRHAL